MKVFSAYKWLGRRIFLGDTEEDIAECFELWADKCDGLTPEEMDIKYGCGVVDEWLEEVDA